MAPKSFRPGLTPLEDRTVPSITPADVFAAAAQADAAQEQLQGLIEKKVEFMNVYTIAYLKDYLPTLSDESLKSARVLAEFQNTVTGQAAVDPTLTPLIKRAAEFRYKAEVNALYGYALTAQVGGIPLGTVGAPTAPDQPIPPTPPPAPPAPPPAPPLTDVTAPTFTDLGTGVKIQDTTVGQGAAVVNGQDVNVFYTGFLKDGTVFDGNRDMAATKFNTNGVIQGFKQGLIGMKPGGVRNIFIPSALGYGAAGSGASIPPNSDLVFEVKLLSSSSPVPSTP